MKLSASIYSQEGEPLQQVIRKLDEHGIDFYHVDCNDNEKVFADIEEIRKWSNKPIDLHIISGEPEKFYPLLEKYQPEYLTFQYEDLEGELSIPKVINSRKGLAISSDTDIEVFESFKDDFDFVLMMATTPGMSGGHFDKRNFRKIRDFNRRFPGKKIHVDGGVNAEISFILRNMGVYAAVSGSYLFNAAYLGAAMLNLKRESYPSTFHVRDFMLSNGEVPILLPGKRTFLDILNALEKYRLGFAILADASGKMEGIITNADLRRALIKNIDKLNDLDTNAMVNRSPVSVKEDFTVSEMLSVIKAQQFPISYMPVVDENNHIKGAITFFNLVKGE
ncbi:MAG: CBS domain-containing protein [Bacteroidota bacterium]